MSQRLPGRSRQEYVQALITSKQVNLLSRLEKDFRVDAFMLDRRDGVRRLNRGPSAEEGEGPLDAQALAEQLPRRAKSPRSARRSTIWPSAMPRAISPGW